MLKIDRNSTVLVTGATGYVAGWIIHDLLALGITVHAAVRDPDDGAKIRHLNDMAARLPGTIRYFKTDLLADGSYAHAMQGCCVVFHTASPHILDVDDPRANLLDPAEAGTRNVLNTADRTSTVTRVVLTSSCAAIYGDNADLAETADGYFTEFHWNASSSLDHLPYSYSKTMSERAAWSLARASRRWDLVVINPSLVIGPAINPHATSASVNLVRQLGNGKFKAGVPALAFGVVDVRDVADAHVRAAFTPAAHGRYIVSGHSSSLLALADALRPAFGRYPLPGRVLPKWLVWLAAPLADWSTTRRFVGHNVGLPWKADNSKSVDELGMSYRPIEGAIRAMFQQLIDSGQLRLPAP